MLTKQALGNTLWGMADILRGKVEDYKAYILSLLFFKRLSDNYVWETENAISEFKTEKGREPTTAELKIIVSQKHDFIIPENCFWKNVKDVPLYPYLLERDKNMTLLNSNLEKLRTFLDSLKIVK